MGTAEVHPGAPGQTSTELTIRGDIGRRLISAAEFRQLADVPAAAEWLANVDNQNTRRAYRSDVGEFMSMLGIRHFGELPLVRRAHVIAWRKMLEARGLGPATRSRKLSASSSLFRYLCNANAVHENPVSGVKRPRMENANEGRTPALSDAQARRLLSAPEGGSLQARRDRALLAVLLYHGLRRDEVARLTVGSHLVQTTGTPVFVVLNAVSPQGREADDAAAIAGLGIDVAPTRLVSRVAYARSLVTGLTAQEFQPKGKAAKEVSDLHAFTCAHLHTGRDRAHDRLRKRA